MGGLRLSRRSGIAAQDVYKRQVQHVPVGRGVAQWYRVRGEAQEALVLGVARAHELHPGKVILLDGIDDSLFWGAIEQRPFLFLRIPDVYLTPGSESGISAHPEMDDLSKFVLPAEETRRALDRDCLLYTSRCV